MILFSKCFEFAVDVFKSSKVLYLFECGRLAKRFFFFTN